MSTAKILKLKTLTLMMQPQKICLEFQMANSQEHNVREIS